MGWKFSSSCHIDSSFSERNLPIMHTSSKRALGWSLRAHSTLIPGLLWGQHRSSLQHLDSLEGAKHCLNVDNVSAHAERAVYRDASSLRGEYKHCCHVLIHLFIFCLGLSLNTSMRKDVFSSAALLLRNHNISVKELVSKCCERRANYARIYRPFCIFFKVILPFWHYSHCRISINVILNRSITDTG